MHFDLISVFPQFFAALDLSLLGRARQLGLVQVQAHDLRDWTKDRHRSVDDTPAGGGAGMVMRPDIWGRAIDAVVEQRRSECESNHQGAVATDPVSKTVLAIPTPSGRPLTQELVQRLAANSAHIVIACGRYEGIDDRVARYYEEQADFEVLEFSLGDYVLNGGEVAAIVLVEAVSRLVEGVVGNPESLNEESFTDPAVLEYPVYTRPNQWRGLQIPAVLGSGNHAQINRWRRNQSWQRTAWRRPELLDLVDINKLDIADRECLARAGFIFLPDPRAVTIRLARKDEASALADFARSVFPLACPDYLTQEAQEQFMTEELSVECFQRYLDQPDRIQILVAQVDEALGAYTLTEVLEADEVHTDPGVAQVTKPGTAYLSKCYTRADLHGSGISGALLEAAVEYLEQTNPQVEAIALGTNDDNYRARKFYRRHHFFVKGRRIFEVGGVPNRDVVMVRQLQLS